MINIEKIEGNAGIEYPCNWIYKVIGSDFNSVKEAIAEVISDKSYSVDESNTSSKGAYVSVKVELLVENEDIRNSIFNNLKQHSKIKMVL